MQTESKLTKKMGLKNSQLCVPPFGNKNLDLIIYGTNEPELEISLSPANKLKFCAHCSVKKGFNARPMLATQGHKNLRESLKLPGTAVKSFIGNGIVAVAKWDQNKNLVP